MSQPQKKYYPKHKVPMQVEHGDLSTYVFGKPQPSAIPLEETVIGALMLDKDAIEIVMGLLKEKDFYDVRHQFTYKAILALYDDSRPIDILLVTQQLARAGDLEAVGGSYYLVNLTNRVASAANIEYHARIIKQKSVERELIKICCATIGDAFQETTDVFDLLEQHENEIDSINEEIVGQEAKDIATNVEDFRKQMDEWAKNESGIAGVPTGFADQDRIVGGWQATKFIVRAARPGMGKTTKSIQEILNSALDFAVPVGVLSLEMDRMEFMLKMAANLTNIPMIRLKEGFSKLEKVEQQTLMSALERIAEAPIFIDDNPNLTLKRFRAKAARLVRKHGVRVLYIDYLQLMKGDGDSKAGNREQIVAEISRGLKITAKELGIAVIALCQLSRAVETRGGTKRPQLSDLRESGAIEQDADIVEFIYRPEYYNILEDEHGDSIKGIAETIIAKHRGGALCTIKQRVNLPVSRWEDLDETPPLPTNQSTKKSQDQLESEAVAIFDNSKSQEEMKRNRVNDEDIIF